MVKIADLVWIATCMQNYQWPMSKSNSRKSWLPILPICTRTMSNTELEQRCQLSYCQLRLWIVGKKRAARVHLHSLATSLGDCLWFHKSNTSESCSQCINFGLVYFQLSKTASCWGLCGGDGCTRPHGYLNKYHWYHFKQFEYLRTAWFIQIHQILCSPFFWCFVFSISQLFSISLFEVAFHNVHWALAWRAQGVLRAPCDEKGVCWSTKNMAHPMLSEPFPLNFGTWFINVHLIFADSAC